MCQVELGVLGIRRGQGPALGGAEGETSLLKGAQGVAEAGVVDPELLPESGSGDSARGVLKDLAHGLGEGGWGGVVALDPEAQWLVTGVGEGEEQGVGRRCCAVLHGQAQALIGASDEVTGRVGPGVEIGAAAERLAGVPARALGHVVDDDEGEVVAAVELAEEAEEAGDVGSAVFVEAVKPDEGIEEQESGLKGREGLIEGMLVIGTVETKTRRRDDLDVEGADAEPPVAAQVRHAVPNPGEGVLGEVDEGGAGAHDFEATETGGAGGDGDGEIEAEPGFAGLGRPANDADGGGAPEIVDEPANLLGFRTDGVDGHDGQSAHIQMSLRAAMTSPEETTALPARAASSMALSARWSMALKLPLAISKRLSRALSSKGGVGAPATAERWAM